MSEFLPQSWELLDVVYRIGGMFTGLLSRKSKGRAAQDQPLND